jgi:signal peptidase
LVGDAVPRGIRNSLGKNMKMPRWLGRVMGVILLAIAAAWLILLRPTVLGGPTTYVFVGGDSMLPTIERGDLIVANQADAYTVGMIVVYRIPTGEPGAGALVIHRIVGGDSQNGFTTQGDHNAYTDIWHPRSADVLGTLISVVPRAGPVVALVREPLPAASLAALLVIYIFWPRHSGPDDAMSNRRPGS